MDIKHSCENFVQFHNKIIVYYNGISESHTIHFECIHILKTFLSSSYSMSQKTHFWILALPALSLQPRIKIHSHTHCADSYLDRGFFKGDVLTQRQLTISVFCTYHAKTIGNFPTTGIVVVLLPVLSLFVLCPATEAAADCGAKRAEDTIFDVSVVFFLFISEKRIWEGKKGGR